MLRLLVGIIILFLIFQVGVSFGKQSADENQVIVNEADLEESSNEVEDFEVKHENQLKESESEESGLFSVARLLETQLKNFFSILFEFLHRFAMLFW